MCRLLPIVVFLLALTPGVRAEDASRASNLLDNGSFEQVAAAHPPKDLGQGVWSLGADKQLPGGWTLNAGYPGVLTVRSEEAAEGERCIEVAAGAARDAQLFRPCPGIQARRWYRVSVRVRGGAATLLIYEYAASGSPTARTLGSVSAPEEGWRTVTGFYAPVADDFRSASVALLVPKGQRALLDDVRVEALEGPVAPSDARPIRLASKAAAIVISGAGQLESITCAGSEENLAATRLGAPVLQAQQGGVWMPVSTLTKKGSSLVARFPDPSIAVTLRAKTEKGYVLFEVMDVKPRDLEGLALGFPVKPRRVRDAWMPGTYDMEVGIAHMGVSATTQTRLIPRGAAVVPEARWWRAPGIRGGRSALLVARGGQLLQTIRQMELDTGLPSPVLRSSVGDNTASTDWVRLSPAIQRSYLFATHLDFGDIDKLIEYARLGGFGLIMLHRRSWRASAGHETIARTAFPDGLPTLEAVCKRIHAAGLGVGLHVYGPAVSTNDAYVTPVPDKRLFAFPVGTLARAAKQDATTLVLRERPKLPRRAAADLYPGDLLRIGDEIVRWKELAPDEPVRLLGCERGVFGTGAQVHRQGAPVRALVMRHGDLLVDPDSTLPEEMGTHLARVVNACQAELLYFDGCAAAAPGHAPENWYYLNRTVLASCAGFDHGVIVQMGTGPGRQLPWHLVPRSASADGHGDLKRYLDGRMAGIEQMRRTHTAADIGWYALDLHGRPDELEYVCAKALALDASVSVQAHRALLDSHPRAREVFEMIERWEHRRLAGDVPAAQRALLREKGRDVRLLEAEDGWSLWDARYEADRPIPALDGKANLWTVTNDRPTDVRLSFEIERVALAATPAEHAAPTAIDIEGFREGQGFALRDAPALAPHILLGGRRLMADGFSRRGVKTTIEAVADPSVGGTALELTVASSIGGAGWGAAGKTLPEPLDLSKARSLGFWVHGDGRGASLALTIVDQAGARTRHTVTLDYEGWRFQSFEPGGPADMDWKHVAQVIVEVGHVPPRATIRARVAALRAMPTRHEPQPMPSVTLRVGRREVDLLVALEPGRVITVDALARGMVWPGGMQPGSEAPIAGGPFLLPPGAHRVGILLQDPAGYAGDLRVRVCRTWPLGP